jgi:hypothetical protein
LHILFFLLLHIRIQEHPLFLLSPPLHTHVQEHLSFPLSPPFHIHV